MNSVALANCCEVGPVQILDKTLMSEKSLLGWDISVG